LNSLSLRSLRVKGKPGVSKREQEGEKVLASPATLALVTRCRTTLIFLRRTKNGLLKRRKRKRSCSSKIFQLKKEERKAKERKENKQTNKQTGKQTNKQRIFEFRVTYRVEMG